jgi:hypothetical protein
LPSSQRRVLLLVQLAHLAMPAAARELGVTLDVAERNLQAATANLAVELDMNTVAVRPALASLDGALDGLTLPRPSIVRRAGQKRRQAHTLVAVVAAVAVSVGAGAVAYEPVEPTRSQAASGAEDVGASGRSTDAPADGTGTVPGGLDRPSAEDLLDRHQISRLGPSVPWAVAGTHNNTTGDGINTICQQTRFADPDGLSALVRRFEAAGKVPRSAVQTVEVSHSVAQAREAYATTVSWYAGCRVGRLQILRAYDVGQVGDEAGVLVIRVWKRPVTTYSVAVARIGAVVTSTVGRTVGAAPPPAGQVAQSLADAVAMLCARSGSTGCAKRPVVREAPPPPTGQERGILAVADLPPVGDIRDPWFAARVPARPNPSATTCDRARFSGVDRSRAWTYLIPGANLPTRFGLSETYGVFPDARRAQRFLEQVRASVARCEDRDLATTVTDSAGGTVARSGARWSTWHLETEVSERRAVRFRVGFVRMGRAVAQLTFVSAPRDDIRGSDFRALTVRAGDRLRELG